MKKILFTLNRFQKSLLIMVLFYTGHGFSNDSAPTIFSNDPVPIIISHYLATKDSLYKRAATSAYEDILKHRSGYAKTVTGGLGGEVVILDSLDIDDFRKAVSGDAPRWIRFSPGLEGSINLEGILWIGSNKTIDGRGANIAITAPDGCYEVSFWDPSSDYNDQIENLIIHNITFRNIGGGDNCGTGLGIGFGANNVWIDHVTFTNIGDESLHMAGGAHNVTSSWNRFVNTEKSNTLSWNDETSANGIDTKITFTSHHNYFYNTSRIPLMRYGTAHYYNNYISHWGWGAAEIQEKGLYISENNIYDKPDGSPAINTSGNKWGSSGCAISRGDIFTERTAKNRGPCFNDGSRSFVAPYEYSLEKADEQLQSNIEKYAGWSETPQWR